MIRIKGVLFGFTLLLCANSSFAMPAPSRTAVIHAAGQLTMVTDKMSIFAQTRGYPNTANDLANIMEAAMRVDEAARFAPTPLEAKEAYNDIVRTWFQVRQRINTICRFHSLLDCYYIRNNVRLAINRLAFSLGTATVKGPVYGNADDAPMHEIPVNESEQWGEPGNDTPSGDVIPQPEPQPQPSPSTGGGWNP